MGADANALTEIAHRATGHWGYSEELMALWRNDLTFTSQYIEGHAVFVAIEALRPIGVYALSGAESGIELEHFWVEPEFIGRGIGRALFEHARRTARELGAKELRIASDPHAEGFYVRAGARRIGVVDSQPGGRKLPLLLCEL